MAAIGPRLVPERTSRSQLPPIGVLGVPARRPLSPDNRILNLRRGEATIRVRQGNLCTSLAALHEAALGTQCMVRPRVARGMVKIDNAERAFVH